MVAKIGQCPVLTERSGEKTGHIMHPRREYCAKCPPRTTGGMGDARSLCGRLHVTYRACNSCGEFEQRDWHPCDQIINMYVGNWPHYSYCDKKGVELRDEHRTYAGTREKGKRWLCKRHFPENIEGREAEVNRRGKAKYDAGVATLTYGYVGRSYEKILLEVAGWMAANTELVTADEWLGKIANMIADNTKLMEALNRGSGFPLGADGASEEEVL